MFKETPPLAEPHPPNLDAALRREAVHYARVLGCAPDVADDVTQEAYVSLWQAGLLLERPAPLVRAALRSAVRYRVLEVRRQKYRDRTVQDEAWADAVDHAWKATAAGDDHDRWLDALRGCRSKLRGRAQKVAELFYDEQLSRNQVAARLGMKQTGVKTMLQRLRATLRQCIERSVR